MKDIKKTFHVKLSSLSFSLYLWYCAAQTYFPFKKMLNLWCNSYFILIGEGVSCHISYSIVNYLYVSCSGAMTLIGEEQANFSTIIYLQLCGFC